MLQPFDFSTEATRKQFDRRAKGFEYNDYLLREVERRMFERLDVVRITPASVVDLGCGLGAGVIELARRYPQAKVLGVDMSPNMIARARDKVMPPSQGLFSKFLKSMGASTPNRIRLEVAEFQALPLPVESVDLFWSNLAFHWLGAPDAALCELYRTAKPGSLLMFSAFGVDTLQEIRPQTRGPEARQIDLMRFRDMHDWGDALVEIGYAEPVMDMERITLSFSDPKNLLKDLHRLGGNPLNTRRSSLAPASLKEDLLRNLSKKSAPGEKLTLTFEIVYGHAWVPPKKKRSDGLSTIDFLPKPPGRR